MKKVYVNGFKGCITDKLPLSIQPDELAFVMNMNLNNDGSLSQREGSVLVQSFSNIATLLRFEELRDGVLYKHLVVIEGSNIYMYDGYNFVLKYDKLNTKSHKWDGNWFVNTFLFSNSYATYALYYDETSGDYKIDPLTYDYINDGSSQVVDIITGDIVFDKAGNTTGNPEIYYKAKVDQTGIDLSTEDFSNPSRWENLGEKPDLPAGECIEQFDNRLFLAGDGTENLYFSNQGDPLKWDVTDFIAVGAIITAIKTVGEFLFVGTNKGLFKLSATGNATLPYQLTMLTEDWILHHGICEVTTGVVGAITKEGNFILFNQYAKEGSEITYKAGLAIRDYLLNIQNGDDLQILTFENRVIITCNINYEYFITNDIKNNAQLVLNNNIFGWTFYNLPIFTFQVYDGKIYYSDYDGNVFRLDENIYQDNGQEFETYLVTSIFTDKSPEIVKNFRRVFLIANPKTKTTIRVYWNCLLNIQFNDNRTENKEIYASGGYWGEQNWGEFIWGGTYAEIPTYRVDSTGKGLQLKIIRASENSDLKIQGYIIEYQPAYIKGTNY